MNTVVVMKMMVEDSFGRVRIGVRDRRHVLPTILAPAVGAQWHENSHDDCVAAGAAGECQIECLSASASCGAPPQFFCRGVLP